MGEDPGNAAYVQRLAERVDAKMRQVARETRLVDSVRIAVLAAMNLADENELLHAQIGTLEQKLGRRARALSSQLDGLLERAR
ncbi:MAG: cell division protein ZapA [Terriglobales bacterium]